MEKEGKVDLLSILFASIVIFLVYAVMVFGLDVVISDFPENATNASATIGFADSSVARMSLFNGTNASFRCNITLNDISDFNVTNVTLYLNTSGIQDVVTNPDANQTFYVNQTVNQTINFSVGSLNEGNYFWTCAVATNATTLIINSTANRTFTIDKTPPGFRSNITNTSNAAVSTGDSIFVAVNATDSLTTIKVAALYVNLSGIASNEVDNTTIADRVANNTINLTLAIPGFALGHVLNFTIRINDSVDNFNITSALIFSVDGDGTPPSVILNKPINLFNQTSTTAPDFNFTADDNNLSNSFNLTCGINLTLGGSLFTSVSRIIAANGTPQTNTTTTALSNGTYTWNVSCKDPAGNVNESLFRTFTVDQIPPVLSYFNITNRTTFNSSAGHTSEDVKTYDQTSGGSIIQGGTIYAVANWTDNLTQPFQATLQFYNGTTWQTINVTNVTPFASPGWSNVSFPIPTGHNEFEGTNVSFRIIANDTLGNVNTSASVKNITIQINDTTYPDVSIPNGSVQVNKTTISDPTPTISWVVNERNELSLINVSIDANTHGGSGLNTCRTAAIFRNTDVATDNVENNRNGTFTVLDDPSCSLLNGTHFVNITAIDLWGNTHRFGHTFNVQSGSVPGLQFNLTGLDASGSWIKTPNGTGTWNDTSSTIATVTTNRTSNITSLVGITLFGYNGAAANISNITYISSCNSSSTVLINNNTVVYPFNESSCNSQSENRTLTVTVTDSAGNSNETIIGFLVDNVGPTISVVHDPKPGQTFTNIPVTFNVSAFDDGQALSSFGFFLDGGPTLTVFNISNAGCVGCSLGGQGINLSTFNNTINLTSGTHNVKLRVNDTLGNARNSSDITFTIVGPITFADVNNSLNTYLSNLNPDYAFNTTIRLRNDSGDYNTVSTPTESNNTFEIFLSINSSGSSYLENNATNITIKEINGSGANWDKINFSIFINETNFKTDAENNFTASLLHFVFFNNSFDEFLPNQNDYFATILLPYNISSYNSSGGSLSTAQEVWYFPNSSDLAQRTNVSICTTGFSRTSTNPCWNYTAGGKTLLSVPHFNSGGGIGNDTRAPTVTIQFPKDTQVESTFVANITVSNDAVLCNVSYVGAGSSIGNKTMTGPTTFGSSKVCTFQLNVTNGTAQNNNISFQVYDGSNNLNTTTFNFNVSDTTVHNVSSVSAGSLTSSGATITLNANESVNLTIHRGTTIELTSTTNTSQSGFSTSPSVSISSLSASTTYYYNTTSCDKAGNCLLNGTFNFTTSAAATTTTTTTTTTSGGGGGGGGGGAVSKVADSKAQVWTTIPAGSSFSLNIDKDTIGITSVSVSNIKSELSNVEVEVQALKDNPVSAAAAAKVYQYLRINKKNLVDADTDKITINFRVPKSWLTDNHIASGDISLYRYVDNTWNKLTVKVTGNDATYVYFEAVTPGFSYFAIGSKAGADAFAIIDAIRDFYAGTSSLSAFDIIDMIRAFYGG